MNRLRLAIGAASLFCFSGHALTLQSAPASEHDTADDVKAYQEKLHKEAKQDQVVRKAEETTGKVARSLTTWKSAAARADDNRSDDWAWAGGHANTSNTSAKDAKIDDAAKAVQAYQQGLHKEAQQDHKTIRIENVTMATAHAATKWKNTTYGKEQYEGQLDATDWAWGAGEAKLNATTNMSIEPAKNATLPKLVAKPKPKPLTKEEVQIKAMAEEAKMDGSSPAYLSEHDAAAEVNAYQKKLHKAAVTDKDVQTTDKRNDRVARSMTSWKSAGQRTHANADDEGLDMDDWAWNARHSNSSALPGSDKKKEHDASVDVKAYQAKLHLDTQKDKAVTTFSNATEVKVKTLTKWKNSSIRNEGYDVEEQKDDWAWSGNNSQKSNLRGQ